MDNTIPHPHGAVGHEKSEADVRLVLQTLVVLAISVILCCAIVYGMFILFKSTMRGRVNADSPPAMLAPSPRITEHPAEEIKGLHAREDQILNSYGWVDQNAGLVHIPIGKAMEDVVATLPIRPSQAPNQKSVAQQKPPVVRQQGGASGNPQ